MLEGAQLSKQTRHDLILRRYAQGWHVLRIAEEVGMSRRGVEMVLERTLAERREELARDERDELLLVVEGLRDGHVLPEAQEQAAAAMEALLGHERSSDLDSVAVTGAVKQASRPLSDSG